MDPPTPNRSHSIKLNTWRPCKSKAAGLRKTIHQTNSELQVLRQIKLAVDAKKNCLKQNISGYDAQLASLAADKLKINSEKEELVSYNQQLESANQHIQTELDQIKMIRLNFNKKKCNTK